MDAAFTSGFSQGIFAATYLCLGAIAGWFAYQKTEGKISCVGTLITALFMLIAFVAAPLIIALLEALYGL